LADFGATWLGWDVCKGVVVPQFGLTGLHDITMTPRKYGFHATLKPPFRLREGETFDGLADATKQLAAALPAAQCDGLELASLGRFIAFRPRGDGGQIRRVADACVRDLDRFRAPATEGEAARRRKAQLSPRQHALLTQWGYPYVMEEFHFHLTLTGQLPKDDVDLWQNQIAWIMPDLPEPFLVDEIALCGERQDRCFEVIHRYALTG
jgi:hypothetical protein